MTTILAGANWTMWPGLSPSTANLTTRPFGDVVRDHAREAYCISSTDTFTREHAPVEDGWFGLMCRPLQSRTEAIDGYILEFLNDNDEVLLGIWHATDLETHGDICVNGEFTETPIVVLNREEDLSEISVRFRMSETDGLITIFRNREQVFSFNGDTINGLNPQTVKTRFSRGTARSEQDRNPMISELLLSTESTLGFKVVDTELSGATLTQWDGTPSNITPVGYASAEDSLSTENADQLVTFSRPDIPALDEGEFVASVHFETSQLAESGAPAPEADLLVYDGSEHGAERIQPVVSFSEFRVQWDQDPRTNESWTEAGVNEIEVGVASRTA